MRAYLFKWNLKRIGQSQASTVKYVLSEHFKIWRAAEDTTVTTTRVFFPQDTFGFVYHHVGVIIHRKG